MNKFLIAGMILSLSAINESAAALADGTTIALEHGARVCKTRVCYDGGRQVVCDDGKPVLSCTCQCDIGYYSAVYDTSCDCLPCAAGTYSATAENTATSCKQCPKGTYSAPAAAACTSCADATVNSSATTAGAASSLITDCLLPSGYESSDAYGGYEYTHDCNYSN